MSREYIRFAQRRTVLARLQRFVLDELTATDGAQAREIVSCEEVFGSDAPIPQDVVLEIYGDLQKWEAQERGKMNEYSFVHTPAADTLAFLKPTPTKETTTKPPETT